MPTSSKKVQKSSVWQRLRKRRDDFLARGPHRTLQLTRRRDYVRPLNLPGYISFTHEVNKTVWTHKKIFGLLVLVLVVMQGVLVGVSSQETYGILSDSLQESGQELTSGDWSAVDQAAVTLLSIASLGNPLDSGEAQQIFAVFIFTLTWLVTVWLLRNLMAGHRVTLRDGLYNAGSPIVASIVILMYMVIQLLPVGIAALGYIAASQSGLLEGGAVSMMFWIAASLLAVLSAFWLTSSLFALILVTLPGMYPYRAIRTAGDLVLGRRMRILFRWLWMVLCLAVLGAALLMVVVLLDLGLKTLIPATSSWPVVPFAILILSVISTVWSSTYVYLLYRKVVDNGTDE